MLGEIFCTTRCYSIIALPGKAIQVKKFTFSRIPYGSPNVNITIHRAGLNVSLKKVVLKWLRKVAKRTAQFVKFLF